MEDKNFKVSFEKMEAIGFNNDGHMHNFMHYLFRTDKAQKHTNELTNDNLYFFYSSGPNVFYQGNFGESLGDRQEIKNECYKKLYGMKKEFPELTLVNSIVYFNVTVDGEDVIEDLSESELMGIFEQLAFSVFDYPRDTIFVMHVDQEGLHHIHAVYLEDI